MLVSLSSFADLLRYPGQPEKSICFDWKGESIHRAHADGDEFLVCADQPVLIDFTASVCRKEWFASARKNVSVLGKRPNFARMIKGLMTGSRSASTENIQRFKTLLPPDAMVLMVGAGANGARCDALYADPHIRQIAFDIYPSNLTQFVADAHKIPLASASVDGVVIQAVLEHVLEPAIMAEEIFRVLKPGGVIYAEPPFLQQIHEGAYDFTHFTELGHRWLFRNFGELNRDVIGGPGLSLYWSARYFWRAVLRNRRLADIVSLPFLLFSACDHLLPLRHKVEGANGVCFLGRKSEKTITPDELISSYLGPTKTGS